MIEALSRGVISVLGEDNFFSSAQLCGQDRRKRVRENKSVDRSRTKPIVVIIIFTLCRYEPGGGRPGHGHHEGECWNVQMLMALIDRRSSRF